MSVRISWRATGLVVGAGLMAFAGGPGESVAQTRAEWDQVRLSLSAAIEEVRRSPFHAGTTGAESWKGQANDTETDGTAASHLFQPGPQEGPSSARTVTLTFLAAGVSHVAAWYLFFRCGFDESNNASDAGCILGPLVPLPVAAAPVWLAGVSPDRASECRRSGCWEVPPDSSWAASSAPPSVSTTLRWQSRQAASSTPAS